MNRPPPSRQRGAAALVVTLILCFVMLLSAGFVNRNLVFEQRVAANQVRSTQAFEAAEAGLEWAIAQLNANQRIGADCLPVADGTSTSFRTRYLGDGSSSAGYAPVMWMNFGVAAPLQVSCQQVGSAWSCSCPVNGQANLTPSSALAPAPAFSLQFLPAAVPGVVQLRSIGCTSLAGACRSEDAGPADATAQLQITLAVAGSVRTPPAAAITTRGTFEADAAALGVHNADPATGVAIHAGGAVAASSARFTAPAGATLAGVIVDRDATLAALTSDQFFARHLGLDKSRWQNQGGVSRLSCVGNCAGALTAAIDAADRSPSIWIDGDLTLSGPITLGSPGKPVLLVASGAIRLDGAVAIHGALYGASLEWQHTSGGAFLRGAALSETSYRGEGAPEIAYDPAVLATLARTAGSFTRVSGSWRDF